MERRGAGAQCKRLRGQIKFLEGGDAYVDTIQCSSQEIRQTVVRLYNDDRGSAELNQSSRAQAGAAANLETFAVRSKTASLLQDFEHSLGISRPRPMIAVGIAAERSLAFATINQAHLGAHAIKDKSTYFRGESLLRKTTSANDNDVISINEERGFPSARDNNWHSQEEPTNVFTLASAIDEKKLICVNTTLLG